MSSVAEIAPCHGACHRASTSTACSPFSAASRVFRLSSSSGVCVRSCSACIPPACASSSFNSVYTILCRAGCILDLKASEVMITLLGISAWERGGDCDIFKVERTGNASVRRLDGGLWFYSSHVGGYTSFEVLPCMALWCECRCESLNISNVVGLKVSVICYRVSIELSLALKDLQLTFALIASSIGVIDCTIAESGRLKATLKPLANMKTVR